THRRSLPCPTRRSSDLRHVSHARLEDRPAPRRRAELPRDRPDRRRHDRARRTLGGGSAADALAYLESELGDRSSRNHGALYADRSEEHTSELQSLAYLV